MRATAPASWTPNNSADSKVDVRRCVMTLVIIAVMVKYFNEKQRIASFLLDA